MYCPNHMSSVPIYMHVCAAALFANMANRLFAKPFEQFAPEERVETVIKNNICLNKFTFLRLEVNIYYVGSYEGGDI